MPASLPKSSPLSPRATGCDMADSEPATEPATFVWADESPERRGMANSEPATEPATEPSSGVISRPNCAWWPIEPAAERFSASAEEGADSGTGGVGAGICRALEQEGAESGTAIENLADGRATGCGAEETDDACGADETDDAEEGATNR